MTHNFTFFKKKLTFIGLKVCYDFLKEGEISDRYTYKDQII